MRLYSLLPLASYDSLNMEASPGNYKDQYDVMEYLNFLLTEEKEMVTFLLKSLNDFFSKIDGCDRTILDYACGPSLLYEISASFKMVLADYNKLNVEFIKNWLKDPIGLPISSV